MRGLRSSAFALAAMLLIAAVPDALDTGPPSPDPVGTMRIEKHELPALTSNTVLDGETFYARAVAETDIMANNFFSGGVTTSGGRHASAAPEVAARGDLTPGSAWTWRSMRAPPNPS